MLRPFKRHAAIALVLLLAAILRFSAVSFGLPVRGLYGDERITYRLVAHVVSSGDWNTDHWKWPNLNVFGL